MEKKYSKCKNFDTYLCPEVKTKPMREVLANMDYNTPHNLDSVLRWIQI